MNFSRELKLLLFRVLRIEIIFFYYKSITKTQFVPRLQIFYLVPFSLKIVSEAETNI